MVINYPRPGTLGYKISYPLFVVVMLELSVAFVTLGLILHAYEVVAWRWRRWIRSR